MENKFCTQCGAKIQDGSSFCTECGARFDTANNQQQSYTVPPQTYIPVDAEPSDESPYKPVSTWGYVGLRILFCIPVIGFICAIIFACGGCKKIGMRNYARAQIILGIAGAVIAAVIIALFSTLFMTLFSHSYSDYINGENQFNAEEFAEDLEGVLNGFGYDM